MLMGRINNAGKRADDSDKAGADFAAKRSGRSGDRANERPTEMDLYQRH